jgi:hypothetical protein
VTNTPADDKVRQQGRTLQAGDHGHARRASAALEVVREILSDVTGIRRYRLPDGAEVESDHGSTVTFRITMPSDDVGHIGRRCPLCRQLFRMHADDYAALPDDLRLTCPYCQFSADHSEFITPQQLERAQAAVGGWAQQMAADEIGKALDNMVRTINRSSSRGGMVSMTASRGPSRAFPPSPLPTITESAPIRERQCQTCWNRYAVFGQHIACPVCGPLPPKVVAEDALAAQSAILDALDQLPADVLDQLRELGSVEQTASSALATVVSALEVYLKATFNERVVDAGLLTARRGNIFQRIDDTADLFRHHLGVDLAGALGTNWGRLRVLYGIRHLLTHNNGVVDDRHLKHFPDFPVALGHRVTVSLVDAKDAIRIGHQLLGVT